jgi:outer membrane lipoprotein-sorting protein
MRKSVLLIFSSIIMLSIIFAGGCKQKKKNVIDVIDYIKEINTYSCKFEMVLKNDKQEINYSGKQFYDKKVGYKMELGRDRVFVYKGEKVFVQDLQNGEKYTQDKDAQNVFNLSFVGEYIRLLYTNEDIKSKYKTIKGKNYQLIELIIPGGVRELNKAVLYVDTSDCLPEKLIIYDVKGNEKLQVNYLEFTPNVKVEI